MEQILEQKARQTAPQQRHMGIDALRILSMMMVVMLHVLNQGGILIGGSHPITAAFSLPWLLESLSYCAVNCYALITGYVCIQARHQYKRIVALWFQVFFYSGLITLLFALLQPGTLERKDVWGAFFPMLGKEYWYFTQYTGLFFFLPFLNQLLLGLQKKQMEQLMAVIFVFLSLFSFFINGDLLVTGSGYSMLWLAALYVYGAYFKLYGVRIAKKYALLLYAAGALAAWAGVLLQAAEVFATSKRLLKYTSPAIFLAGLGLFLFFLQCRIGSRPAQRFVRFFAPLSFSVFLIHTHPLIYSRVLKGAFQLYRDYPAALTVLFAVLTTLAIFLVCAGIDWVRRKLFRLMRVERLSQKIVDWFQSALRWLGDRIKPSAPSPN